VRIDCCSSNPFTSSFTSLSEISLGCIPSGGRNGDERYAYQSDLVSGVCPPERINREDRREGTIVITVDFKGNIVGSRGFMLIMSIAQG